MNRSIEKEQVSLQSAPFLKKRKKSIEMSYIRRPWQIVSLIYKSKMFKIEPLLFLYMFSRFFFTPLYQQYYFVRFGSDLLQNTSFPFPNGSFCLNSSLVDKYAGCNAHKTVESYSTNLLLYGQLAVRIPGMITVLIVGPLSDRFGRKLVLLLALFGNLLQSILAFFIIWFQLHPYYFILSNLFTGLCGDFTGVLAGSFSYIADVSSPKWRTFRIGIIEGMLAIGGAFGQFLSGYWLNQNNCNFLPIMGSVVACCLVSLLWVVFLVPESLSRKERLKRIAEKPNAVQVALQGLKIFLGRVPQYSAWKLWAAVVMLNLPLFNTEGNILISVYFLKAPPFDVDATVIGILQSMQSVARAVSVTLVLFSFSVALRLPDSVSAFVGISFQMAANILTGFANRTFQLYFIVVVQGVEAISWAAGRSLMSKLVSKGDQGALFSVVASIQSVVSLLSSLLWPPLYPLTQTSNLPPGFIFLIMALFDVLAYPMIIALMVSQLSQRWKSNKLPSNNMTSSQDKETDKLLVNRQRSYSSTDKIRETS